MRLSDQEANRLQVLEAIRRAEPVARSELAKLTGLSGATITEIIGDLIGRDFLLEEKAPPGGLGRRRVQLRLNPDAARVVGAFLHADGSLKVEIANLRGETLFSEATPLTDAADATSFVEQIAEAILKTIMGSPFDRSVIDSVGVGLPALIDSDGGIMHWLQSFTPQPIPVAAVIAQRLELPVVVDNDFNVIARAEHWFGEGRQVDDFTMFGVGLGLGFGRYVEGRLWNGAHGMNPEMSHVKVSIGGGPLCSCGARGCLQAYATISGIVQHICEQRGEPLPPHQDMTARFHDLVAEARTGDRAIWEAFNLAGRALGTAVANYINAWDPARVVVLAADAALAEVITPAFYAAVHENVLPGLRGLAPLQFRVADEAHYAQGAAALVLERLYRSHPKRPADQAALATAT